MLSSNFVCVFFLILCTAGGHPILNKNLLLTPAKAESVRRTCSKPDIDRIVASIECTSLPSLASVSVRLPQRAPDHHEDSIADHVCLLICDTFSAWVDQKHRVRLQQALLARQLWSPTPGEKSPVLVQTQHDLDI